MGERGAARARARDAPRPGDLRRGARRRAGGAAGHVIALAWAALTERQRRAARRLRAGPRPRPRAVRRRAARLPRAAAERRVRRPRGAHRLRGARAGAGAPRRQRGDGTRAGAGLGGEVRLAGIHSVRPAARARRSTQRAHRDREPARSRRRATSPSSRWTGIRRIAPTASRRCSRRRAKHSLASFAAMQADLQSRLARELLPVARAAKPATPAGRAGAGAARGLGRRHGRRRGRAARLRRRGTASSRAWSTPTSSGALFAESWDLRAQLHDRGDEGRARRGTLVRRRAHPGARDLRAAGGPRVRPRGRRTSPGATAASDRWRWGEAHRAAGDHHPFGAVPRARGRCSTCTPETAGDTYTVNVGHYQIRDADRPVRQPPRAQPARDLRPRRPRPLASSCNRRGSRATSSRRGTRTSPSAGRRCEYITIPTRRAAIEAAHTLVLEPRAP